MWWSSKKVFSFVPCSQSFQWSTCVSWIVSGSTISSPVGSERVCMSYWLWDFPRMALIALPIFPEETAFSRSADAFCIWVLSRLRWRPCIFFLRRSSVSLNWLANNGYWRFSISLQWADPLLIMCASSCCSLVSNCSAWILYSHSSVTLLMPVSISSAFHHCFLRCAPVICCRMVVTAVSAASWPID